VGTKSNRDGLGARVKITPNVGGPQWNHATTATGFSTSSDKRVHFGLGAATTAEVEVTWPSGIRQVLGNVKADQILKVQEEGSVPAAGSVSVPAAGPAPLTERTERH
jgi:hypothetical protein